MGVEVLYCFFEEGGVLIMFKMFFCILFKFVWSLLKDFFLEFGVLVFVIVNIKGCFFFFMVIGLVGFRDFLVLFVLLLLFESLRLLIVVFDFVVFFNLL